MWLQFHDALSLRSGLLTQFRWVPSHIDVHLACDPFERWLFWWNNAIDDIVTRWNWHRPSSFLSVMDNLERNLNWWTDRVRQLRQFYFSVAQLKDRTDSTLSFPALSVEIIEISDEEGIQTEYDMLADQLPLNWAVRCRQLHGKVPGHFVEQLVQWLCAAEQLGTRSVIVSDIELVFLLVQDGEFVFPFQLDGSLNWTMRSLSDLFQQPTVAMLLRPVQFALRHILDLFPGVLHRGPPAPLPNLGVYMNFRGTRLRFPLPLLQVARDHLRRFTQSRNVRRTCDIARPLP